MDELDEGGGVDVARAPVAAGPRGEQHDQRAQALAAARNDVFGDLIDEAHRAFHAGADDGVHRAKVCADEVFYGGKWAHRRAS